MGAKNYILDDLKKVGMPLFSESTFKRKLVCSQTIEIQTKRMRKDNLFESHVGSHLIIEVKSGGNL